MIYKTLFTHVIVFSFAPILCLSTGVVKVCRTCVPNYGTPGRGVRLLSGMTIAIEPMINAGTYEVEVLDDEWTTVTADGKLSAHFEHTIAITPDGPLILTVCD